MRRSGYPTKRQAATPWHAHSPSSTRRPPKSAGRPTPRSETGCSHTNPQSRHWFRTGRPFARSLALPSPEQFDEISHASGLPTRAEDLGVGYDDDLLFWALRNSHLLRERISIVDLADLLGVWSDETAWSIVADAAKAGMKGIGALPCLQFVFMLTHGDRTVEHAAEIVPQLADTGLRYIGFKDVGADASRQRELTSLAHDAGFEVMLEVVSTSKEDELSSLRAAAAAGVDWVLGGTHAADGAGILPDAVRYCPFPGRVVDHPSVLLGTIDEIAADAERLTALDHVSGARPAGVSPSDRRSRRAHP